VESTGGSDKECYPSGCGAIFMRDAAGNLYGTTHLGGTFNYGIVFKVSVFGRRPELRQRLRFRDSV